MTTGTLVGEGRKEFVRLVMKRVLDLPKGRAGHLDPTHLGLVVRMEYEGRLTPSQAKHALRILST